VELLQIEPVFENTGFVEDEGSRNVNMERSLKSGNNTETRLCIFALVANTVLLFLTTHSIQERPLNVPLDLHVILILQERSSVGIGVLESPQRTTSDPRLKILLDPRQLGLDPSIREKNTRHPFKEAFSGERTVEKDSAGGATSRWNRLPHILSELDVKVRSFHRGKVEIDIHSLVKS